MAVVIFTSSEAFMEADQRGVERAEVEVEEYVEACYQSLRTQDGRDVAYYLDGAWELLDGRRFSDWAVRVG